MSPVRKLKTDKKKILFVQTDHDERQIFNVFPLGIQGKKAFICMNFSD